MSRDFYPFVEGQDMPQEGGDKPSPEPLEVHYAARIAVYDDAAAAPRVVVVDPKPVRTYLEEITSEVTRLAHEQGGTIPFMVIREIVENFIHAYFMEPTVSILDHGDTIRFSDQGPGIQEKKRALEYGTSSATEDMRHYIRGVGSGLPYAQQYMQDKGGTLRIDDNIGKGTVVTISMVQDKEADEGLPPRQDGAFAGAAQSLYQQQGAYQQAPQLPQGSYPQQGQYLPQQGAYGQPYYPQQPQGYPVQPGQGAWVPQGQSPYTSPYAAPQQQAQPVWGMPSQQGAVPSPAAQGAPLPAAGAPGMGSLHISERGQAILSFLAQHESVGPSNLVRAYGGSQPTWSRELKELEGMGLVKKDGQKYWLTEVGTLFLGQR